MNVQVLLSMQAIPLLPEQQSVVHSAHGEWEVIETASGKFLVHAITDLSTISLIESYLISLAYTPVIIGVFKDDGISYGQELVNIGTQEVPTYQVQGTAVYPVNIAELATFTTGIEQTHQFGGWATPVLT